MPVKTLIRRYETWFEKEKLQKLQMSVTSGDVISSSMCKIGIKRATTEPGNASKVYDALNANDSGILHTV